MKAIVHIRGRVDIYAVPANQSTSEFTTTIASTHCPIRGIIYSYTFGTKPQPRVVHVNHPHHYQAEQ